MFLADITGDGGLDIVGADPLHSRTASLSRECAIHLWSGPTLTPAPTVTFIDPNAAVGDQLGRVK